MIVYRLRAVTVRYGKTEALRAASLELRGGEFVGIVGPNGAGKSTLVSLLAGLRREFDGSCELDGRPIGDWPRRELSRAAAHIPQSVDLRFPFTAAEVAMMGRAPHASGMFESPDDAARTRAAMEETDCARFASRDFRTLSGGEKQRVVLAAALAQDARAILLDEPASSLDPKHQVAVHELLAARARAGRLVVAATHDLRLAARTCTRIVVLREGRVEADGPPREALEPATFSRVFEVDPGIWLGA